MNLDVDSSLIKKAASGDMDSFETIVTTFEGMIYNICYRYFNNDEDAKDLTQEIFIKIYRNLNHFNFTCKFSTWVYRIAANACIDQLRKKQARPQTVEMDERLIQVGDSAQGPAEALITKDSLKNLGSAISKLPEDYRLMIVLRELQGLSYQEITEITGEKSGTVKSRLSRARQCLRQILVHDYDISV